MTNLKKYNIWTKFKYKFVLLLFALLYWNAVIRLAVLLRLLGARNNDFREVISKGMAFVLDQLFLSSLVISFFAIFSWFILNFVSPKLIRRFKVRRLMLVLVLFDVFVFVLLAILLGIIHYSLDKQLSFSDSLFMLNDFLLNSTTLFFLIVLFIASYVFQLIYTLIHQIGLDRLRKTMMGFYQRPREENRIFMFLDLQSSTTFAEKLGHKRYSCFIQDCFRFLSNPLLQTMGRVYQFVGDEVVVTWDAKKLKNFERSVDFFFLYENALISKKEYFEKKYGMVPVFTASINEGKVMAAEVGEIKRELAFHGDVLNTAARIQKQCKRYRKKILITRNFASKLIKAKTNYKLKYIDIVKFLGKDRIVKIYEVYCP